MAGITLLMVLAVLVEALVEYTKTLLRSVSEGGWNTAVIQLTALGTAVTLCVLARADLFAVLDISLGGRLTGCVLTGILTARGSNYMADLMSRLAQKAS
ncbi:MAG: hypothetical protein IIW40_00710 [Clostridia bacterium]|nr:hypothetical protein [Clostridia bacterium]